jgi:hypothetical protein
VVIETSGAAQALDAFAKTGVFVSESAQSAGRLSVERVLSLGDVVLTVVDSEEPTAEVLELGTFSTVTASGDITITAGDGLTLDGRISAEGAVALAADVSNPDPDGEPGQTGAVVSIRGAISGSSITVTTGTDQDTVSVEQVMAGQTITVLTGTEDDVVNVGAESGRVDAISGSLVIDGQNDNDTVNIVNAADITERILGISSVSTTTTQVTGVGLGASGVENRNVEALNITLGDANNIVQARSTNAGLATRVDAGAGNNVFEVGENGLLDGLAGPVLLVGDGDDLIRIDAAADTGTSSGTLTSEAIDPTSEVVRLTGLGADQVAFMAMSHADLFLGETRANALTVNHSNNHPRWKSGGRDHCALRGPVEPSAVDGAG